MFREKEQEFNVGNSQERVDFEVLATHINEILQEQLEEIQIEMATRESKAISKSLLSSKSHQPVELDHDEITKVNSELNTPEYWRKHVKFSLQTPVDDFIQGSMLEFHIPFPSYWESMNDFSTRTVPVTPNSTEYRNVKQWMNSTIQKHKGNVGGEFSHYLKSSITRIQNAKLYLKYFLKQQEYAHEKKDIELYLFHGCPESVVDTIIEKGFDPRKSKFDGMFGLGVYLADLSSKSNQYSKCKLHDSASCKVCEKKLFLCRALIGDPYFTKVAMRYAKEPPLNKDSVIALSRKDVPDSAVEYREYIFYDKDVVYPEYVISYQLQ